MKLRQLRARGTMTTIEGVTLTAKMDGDKVAVTDANGTAGLKVSQVSSISQSSPEPSGAPRACR